MTVKITLACTECKQRNYNTTKNKKNNPDRLDELSAEQTLPSQYCQLPPQS